MNWLLVVVLAAPALGALLAALIPNERTASSTGLLASLIALAASIALGWDRSTPSTGAIRPWHQVDVGWVPAIGLRFHLGVDGISYPLLVLTTLLTALCCVYTWSGSEHGARSNRLLIALLLTVEVGIAGVFLSLDLILFFLFFEVVLLPMYAIIVGWGGDPQTAYRPNPARRAGLKFVLYTLLGSVLLLVGILLIVVKAGTSDLIALSGGRGAALPGGIQLGAFVLVGLAFAIKSPLWPLHTWLPDAHTEAPTVGSVILAGVLLKMGTYGLIRVGVGVLPEGARRSATVLGVLAVAAILIGSLVCLAQSELKRLIAYSSVGHMGFVLLGIATMTATGLTAALVGNIAHGIITGLLFFLAGSLKHRAHTGTLTDLGGLRERMPVFAGVLAFAAIASLGLPGLAGFWGEAFAVAAAIQRGGGLWIVLASLAAIGGVLTAAYFLRLLRHVTHGRESEAVATLPDPVIRGGEYIAWSPLVLLALAVGLAPAVVLAMAHAPIQAIAAVVR